jgi:mono/diheme cytochrome c family protein
LQLPALSGSNRQRDGGASASGCEEPEVHIRMKIRWGHLFLASGVVIGSSVVGGAPVEPQHATRRVPASRAQTATAKAAPRANTEAPSKAFVDKYCATCHNQRLKTGGLAFDGLDLNNVAAHAAEWEKVVVKLRAGLMPPTGAARPERAVIDGFTSSLEAALDRVAAASPNPGRTEPFHRLNRAEYRNAVRDLLGLEIDVTQLLPTDEISYGFDNIAGVLKLSPLLTERYLNTAQKVARLALGTPAPPSGDLYRVPDQLDQDVRLEGMPVGTRGGTRVDYLASRGGEYVLKVRLGRGIDYDIPHFLGEQQLEISVDGEPVQVFVVPATPGEALNIERQVAQRTPAPNRRADQPVDPNADPVDDGRGRRDLDDDWVVRVPLTAGVHEIRATFLMKTGAVSEGFRKPFLKPYIGRGTDDARETREGAALRELEIMGPFNPGGAEESPSHRRVFVCHPAKAAEEAGCAKTILSTLARRAYRRPVTAADLQVLLDFYNQGRAKGDFHSGIELALQRILVSPSFLFRTEFAPAEAASSGVYRISDVELASRLSFFLWSSIPDDELLDLATQGKLRDPAVLERQARRMLADPRSEAFTTNFAGQWLSLRRLPDIVPDPFLFPDYGDTLARAFQRESELFFDSIVREDRPMLELVTANYTFVNERLAQHYGIPNVKGINFRRVALADDSPRRGLLGKGSILTVTAFPNRTSPVVRGKWVLQNLLGAPPPEPPPNIPGLEENGNQVTKVRTTRERLEQHRANAVCASCHKVMDPIGFALESFDAVGKFRTYDENFEPIDNTGVYADGTRIDGLTGLRQVLVDHSDQVLVTVTKTLLTYALGRGVEYYDAPAVRSILRGAAPQNYRFSSVILGIVQSTPFQMRRSQS